MVGFFCGNFRLTRMYLLLLILVLILGAWTPSGNCEAGIGVTSKKYVKLKAPKVVDPNDQKITLECRYDLDGEGLFSVNWFKDGNEFFRYMSPVNTASGDLPSVDAFDVHGIRVDLSASNDKRVVIHQYYEGKWVNITGSYGCQVSGEGPKFDIMYDEANVTIGVLHAYGDPILKGIKSHYSIGDTLSVTCKSAPVYPPAQLTFFINGRQVKKSSKFKLLSNVTTIPYLEGSTSLSTTNLQLSLILEHNDFNATGSLSLVCQSRLPGITSVKPREARIIISLLQAASAEAVSNNEKQLVQSDAIAPTTTTLSSSASSLLLSTVTTTTIFITIPVILIFNFPLINLFETFFVKSFRLL
ncbi:uncharacterized protein [Chelonus insularis]|uniref:uncharacterized protein n=1 Tax=Chelonus insularis TaxID=460826 RepID=UPI00158A12AA|nr:uncharacterized protein LOC118068794 [Chelonus insularis]